MRLMLRAIVVLNAWCVVGSSSVDQAQVLKQKWSLDSVIRDVDHIKKDMQSLMELADMGEISQVEMIFFLIRMHDFDDNGGLDGIELRAALLHRKEHLDDHLDQEAVDAEILIDEILQNFDKNNNGIIDYAEFRFE